MNVRDFILQHGADEDVGSLADAYLKEALALRDEEERKAALTPAVRQLVSSIASSLRKAQRGPSWSWPGSAQVAGDRGARSGLPAEAPAEAAPSRGHWIAWLNDHGRQTYYIPGSGTKLMLDITAEEWERRAAWHEQVARGSLREAARLRNFAGFLRENGVITARELFT